MLPKEAWWAVITHYNKTIFPLQYVLMGVGLLLLLINLLNSNKRTQNLVKGYLATVNIFIGVFFFIIIGQGFPSPMGEIQGGLFMAIGLLLFYDLFVVKTEIVIPKKQKILYYLAFLMIGLYPVYGLLMGHELNQLIVPFAFPCPTTAFGLLFYAFSIKKKNLLMIVLMLIWAIPFPPFVQIPMYGVYEDGVMFIIGVFVLFKMILSTKRSVESNV